MADNKNMDKFEDILNKVEQMTVIELNDLVKAIEERFGVSAAAVASSAPVVAEAVDEKSEYTVNLTAAGEQKIAVMKVVKEVLALGLKDAKDLVDGAPVDLKVGMKKAEAEDFKKKLEDAGASVTLT